MVHVFHMYTVNYQEQESVIHYICVYMYNSMHKHIYFYLQTINYFFPSVIVFFSTLFPLPTCSDSTLSYNLLCIFLLVSACNYCLLISVTISCVGHILIEFWHVMPMAKIHGRNEWTINFQL